MTSESKQDAKTPGPGHNSGDKPEGDEPANVSGARLKSFLERIERLEEEKKGLSEDIKDVYGEAKATGFEPKIMKKILRLKGMNLEKRREEEELTKLYAAAIGFEV
jgi:uncharacterized protein (UPF0335 family)